MHELMYVGTWAATRGYVPPRRANSAHPSIVPFQNFQTADGWIVVAAPKEKFWVRLCETLGRPELATDPRFADFAARDRNRDELAPILDEAFRERPSADWLEALREAGVPASAVNDVLEAVDEARLVEYEHPTLGTVRQVALAPAPLGRRAAGGPRALQGRARRGGRRSPRRVTWSATAATPPDPKWPGGARLALSFVLNYEEGGESTPLEGDEASEAFLHEVVGARGDGRPAQPQHGVDVRVRQPGRVLAHPERMFTRHGLPLTVYAVGQALERNPAAAKAMVEAGWEVASHGWRWIDYAGMPEDEEREHMRRAIDAIERVCGARPVGWYTGRTSENTRRLVVEEGGFLYDSDSYADELPYWVEVAGGQHLVIPYTLDANDFKFLLPNGFVTADDFFAYLVDTFEQLHEEGGRMMNVGLHCRIVGRPGRAPGLERFLAHVREREDVWVTTRAEIARHWREQFPPEGAAAVAERLQSQLRPTRSQATSLGSHSVLICESSRVTLVFPHCGHGGVGLSVVERNSSKRSWHPSQRYS